MERTANFKWEMDTLNEVLRHDTWTVFTREVHDEKEREGRSKKEHHKETSFQRTELEMMRPGPLRHYASLGGTGPTTH